MKKAFSPYLIGLVAIAIALSLGECKKPVRVVKLTTLDVDPQEINHDGVIIKGEIIDHGETPIQNHGIAISNTVQSSGNFTELSLGKTSSEGVFQVVYENPAPDIQYQYKAFATDGSVIVYGNTKTFRSLPLTVPEVILYPAENITSKTATLTANVASDGGAEVVERGFCYSTLVNPDLNDKVVINDQGGTGEFTEEIIDLEPGSTYYVRAFANNSQGTSYSNEIEFIAAEIPTIETYAPENITSTTAILIGNVINEGGVEVVERGFCYSTSPDVDMSDNVVLNEEGGPGEFMNEVSDLNSATEYYVKAYAINSVGIAYGIEKSFITGDPAAVETHPPKSLTVYSVIINGEIISDGGSPITNKGICWSTGTTPTIDGDHSDEGSGTEPFSTRITALSPSTTYYVRAYVTNAFDTYYGNQISFTVPDPSTFVYSIVGAAYPGGNWETDYDFTYLANSNYVYSYEIPSLELLQGGHFKIRKDHDWEIQYGANNLTIPCNSFTTRIYDFEAEISVEKGTTFRIQLDIDWVSDIKTLHFERLSPEVYTGIAYSITNESAKCEGEVSDHGASPVIERGICYSTDELPTVDDNKVTEGSGLGLFIVVLDNLVPNTTYYYRAFAINDEGISYGEELSFTTQ
ncbi:MAG: fibronectin type III domain-containing protein [Bacteroidota bacterium]|nr:fibronectin type III domain-containing protein [Bacteroidota bacterium]